MGIPLGLGACVPPNPIAWDVVIPTEDPEWSAPASEPAAPVAPLALNELCAANASVVMDEYGEFDDWVEIVNVSDETVELAGWTLADEADEAWPLPHVAVAPGERVVVWTDDQYEQGLWHATFRLSSDEDTVTLRDPAKHIADSWTIRDLGEDVVMGRFPDGGPHIARSIVATPWNANPVDPGLSLDPSDVLFPADRILRFDLYLSDAAYQTLSDDRDAEVEGSLGYEGAYLPEVTIRIKGGLGSKRSLNQKAAFKVDLNALAPGTTLRGLEKLTLNNMVQDPSGVHELVAYTLLRDAHVPGSRTGYARVYLNDEYRGLYLHVESQDDEFLERWFDDPEGNLYEGAYGQDVTLTGYTSLEQDEQGSNDVTDRSDLKTLATLLAQTPDELLVPELDALVDIDANLRMLAIEVLVGHWDGYFYAANNYRIYHEPTVDHFTLLASGLDQTFGWRGDPYSAGGALASWMLQVPSVRQRYESIVHDMALHMMATDVPGIVLGAQDMILPAYEADPYRENTPEAMSSGMSATIDYWATRPDEVLDALP